MDKLMLCISVMLIFGKLIIGIAAEEHPENKLAIFYLNDDSFPESFGNFTQIKHLKPIDANYLYENLSVGYLSLIESFEDDMKTFCHILSKVKVVALLFPHKLRNSVLFFLAGQRLGVPTLHVESTAENNQKNMKVHLIPAPEDSVPTTIKILQKYSWISVAVIYNRLCENCETKMRALLDHDKLTTDIAESIQFFQIISGMPMVQRTRQVAEVFAKIKLSTINKLVVYANNEDIDELLAIGDMMQLTGAEYTWIFPWRIETSTMQTLPVNTMILRPKNARKMEHFLIDGFEVVIRGFHKYRQEHTKWSAHSADCFDPTGYSFGEEFYRHIVQESFVGRTGNVEFDERGNRINADYELVNMADGKILWPENDVLKATLTSDNRKRKLRAVTTLTEPFASINQIASNNSACGTGLPCKRFSLSEKKTTQFCCDGLAIELLHMLEIDLSIDVELHISKDGKYGAFDIETKQWNGMIGELVSNEVDLAVADLTITDDRSRVVDFAHPFMEVGKGVLVRVERRGITKGVWGFLKPVAAQLWITAVCAIFMMGILFWSMEKIAFWIFDRFSARKDDKKREFRRLASARFSFGASLHYSWSTVVRTRDKITPPSNSSAKIGAIGLALCFLVFITTYTAQLAALLVAEEQVSSLTGGIKDTKLQNPSEDLKVAAVSEGSTERFFRTSSEPLYSNIWKHMKDNNVPTIEIGIERLKKREIDVFFGDYSILVYHAANDKDCALQVVGEPFYKAAFGIALQKNSSWTSAVSQKILEYEKYDVFLTLAHRWLKNSCEQTVKDSNNFYRMSSLDLSGVFLMVVGGIFISLVLLATEFLFLRKRKRQAQITIKDGQAVTTAMPRLSTCSSTKDVKM